MSRGAKFFEGMLNESRQENARLKHQMGTYRDRILLLESKLLGVDFSLKNWWRQKVKKERTTNILNYEQTTIRKDQPVKD